MKPDGSLTTTDKESADVRTYSIQHSRVSLQDEVGYIRFLPGPAREHQRIGHPNTVNNRRRK